MWAASAESIRKQILFHRNTSSLSTLYETFFSKQQALRVFDFASGLKWSTPKSKSEIDHIKKHQKGTWQRLLLNSCWKRVNAEHKHPNFLEVNNVVSADVTEISIQPFLNQGIVSLQSTTGRSVFWLNSLWLVNVVKLVLQYRQHCQFSYWFANMATRENKLPLPHKLLFMHWTRELKPQADLLYKVLELLENTH